MPLLFLLGLLAVVNLPTGWRISPAGSEIPLGTFPVYAQALPDGQHVVVLESGFAPPALLLLHLPSGKTVNRLVLPDAGNHFLLNSTGDTLYVPTGHSSSLQIVSLNGTHFTARTSFPLTWPNQEFPRSYATSVALGTGLLAVTETLQDSVALLDAQTGAIRHRLRIANPTFATIAGDALYVLSGAANELVTFHLPSLRETGRISTSRGPAYALIHAGRLYLAAANANTLDVYSLKNPAAPQSEFRIHLAPAPAWPTGMSPTSLAVDPAQQRLYITCSGSNAVAVLNLANHQLLGFVPTAWYPTFSLPLPNAGLLVLNGKGERSFPNPQGPNPTVHRSMTPQPPTDIQYVGLLQKGTARFIPALSLPKLRRLTQDYARLTPPLDKTKPSRLPRAIEHVVFIMKENRTYDQVLGDLPRGAADPSLCLFPRRITPNHHRLAEQFVLLDHFHVNADVSSEGWIWTSAAMVPHFLMQRWPAAYAGRARPQRNDNKQDPLLLSPTGYLWTKALAKGLRVRNYGFYVTNKPNTKPGDPIVAAVADPALLPVTHPAYAGYDPDFPDLERARLFIADWDKLATAGQTPHLTVMVLPNDHTWGTSPGKLTPNASMADNDAALGQIVAHLSRSKAWPKLAIFVLEDDAQNGPDHIDSHRSPAYVISPYTQRQAVDSTFYNTTSMLRTIGLLLGLEPMTQFDATALPMLSVFQRKPDYTPYSALPPNVSLTELNPPRGPLAQRGAALDLSAPDQIDDEEMNELLWLALKGSTPPPPTRAAYRRPLP